MTSAAILWRSIVAIVGTAFALWLLREFLILYRAGLALRGAARLHPVSPDPALVRRWEAEAALLKHVPSLAAMGWRWALAPPTTVLTRLGQRDRTFYWLASGRALVLGRDAEGGAIHLATLREGTGLGEVAFLTDEPRTADTVVIDTAVVAMLDHEQFHAAAGPEDRERFRQAVLAAQAMDLSLVFKGIDGATKERWLGAGHPCSFSAGEVVIASGAQEQWLGLIVEGTARVREPDQDVARLALGDVFGEMALLSGGPRVATVVADTALLTWRWEAEWIRGDLEPTGLGGVLSSLAASRGARA